MSQNCSLKMFITLTPGPNLDAERSECEVRLFVKIFGDCNSRHQARSQKTILHSGPNVIKIISRQNCQISRHKKREEKMPKLKEIADIFIEQNPS